MMTIRRLSMFLLAGLFFLSGCAQKQEQQKTEGESKETMGVVETVTTESCSMKVLKFGTGDKSLVILPGLSVQSVMGSAEAIETAYAKMTDEFTIYLFDRREELPETYSIAEMAKDTIAAIHALGLSEIYLYGTSQGGMISMEIASMEPELIKKLILASTSCEVKAEQNDGIKKWIKLADEKNSEGLYLAFGELVYPKEVFESYRETFIAMAKTVTEAELERFTVLAGTIIDFNCVDDLKQVKCPVLVLGSNDDQVFGKEACPRIAEVLQGSTECELYMYDGYGHAVYDLAPDFLDRIKTFCLK